MTTRRRALMSQYHFHCCCVACTSEGCDAERDNEGEDAVGVGKPSSATDSISPCPAAARVRNGKDHGGGGGGGRVRDGGAEEGDPLEEELRYLAITIGDIQAQVGSYFLSTQRISYLTDPAITPALP